MLFHDLMILFFHVERTGGVSLRKHLLKYETKFERISKTKHLTCEEAKCVIDEQMWGNYFKVGFIRNPYDRLVSWYYACKKNKDTWKTEIPYHMNRFETFEDMVMAEPIKFMLVSQLDKVKDCNYIGRFENYERDVNDLCDILVIPHINIHDNGSDHKQYREHYTEEMRKRVEGWYKKDLRAFGYEF